MMRANDTTRRYISPLVYRLQCIKSSRRDFRNKFVRNRFISDGLPRKVVNKQYINLRNVILENHLNSIKKNPYATAGGFTPNFAKQYFKVYNRNKNDLRLLWLNRVWRVNFSNWFQARYEFDELHEIKEVHRELCKQHDIYDIYSDEAKVIIALSS